MSGSDTQTAPLTAPADSAALLDLLPTQNGMCCTGFSCALPGADAAEAPPADGA